MSIPPRRHLPERPSLEQLRKQAREHLNTLRAADPSVNLAAAQHALAYRLDLALDRLADFLVAGRVAFLFLFPFLPPFGAQALELAPGGGVCGAIHRRAGPELARACARLAPCPTGEARLTPGFALPARFVIHAVGPVWRGGAAGEAALLASAYRASLSLAKAHAVCSVAFPAISTGIYGYPLDQATSIAVAAVREANAGPEPLDVTFCCFDARALKAYQDAGVA